MLMGLYSASTCDPENALATLEQKCFNKHLKAALVEFGLWRCSRQTDQKWWKSGDIRAELVTW